MEAVIDATTPNPSKVIDPVDVVEENTDKAEPKSLDDEKKVTFNIPHRRRPARLQLGGDIKEREAPEDELDQFVKEESESKWRCKVPECTKLFKSHHYWRRHVSKRHSQFEAEHKPRLSHDSETKNEPDTENQTTTEEQQNSTDQPVPEDIKTASEPDLQTETADDDNDDTSSCGSWQPLVKPTPNDVRVLDDEDLDDGEWTDGWRRIQGTDYDEYFEAIEKGDIETVKAKLEKGCKVHAVNITGNTPLVTAIMTSQLDIVRLLLENGADANEKVHTLPPLCHAACQEKHEVEMMSLLLEHGAILTAISGKASKNALHWAVSEGRNDSAEFLLSKGMDIEKTCPQERTPLLLTAEKGHKETAELLLKHGANINAKSFNGGTGLMWSCSHNHADMIEYWIEKGHGINERDNNGNTALLLAAHFGHTEVVKKLLDHGADLTILNSEFSKFSALMAAAGANYPEVVEAILKHPSYPQENRDLGLNALKLALGLHQADTAKNLMAALDPSGPLDSVALQMAMSQNHEMMLSLISVTSLMYPHIKSTEETPGDYAWMEWAIKQGGELVKTKALTNLMIAALEDEKIDMVKAVVAQGCDVNIVLETGHCPLSWAVVTKNIELIKVLLELGADPNTPVSFNETDQSPFDSAIIRMKDGTDTEIVDIFLATGRCKINYGKDPSSTSFSFVLHKSKTWEFGLAEVLGIRMLDSIKDINEDRDVVEATLLHTAVFRESKEFVELLIQRGADIEAKDKYGATPFIVACQRSREMMEILIQHGANVTAKYNTSSTGLMAAVACGKIECIEKAIELGIDLEESTKGGITPLACALSRFRENEAILLINKGANVHWKAKDTNLTTLHLAARHRRYRATALILQDKTININAQCNEGWTALHEAAACGATPMVINLLDAGADIEIPITNGDRPLHIALINGHQNTARVLIERGASITALGNKERNALHLAASWSHPALINLLVDAGLDLEQQDAESWTPLCVCGNLETMRRLLARGANVNYADRDGWTPLHQTISSVEDDCAAELIKAGADLSARTTDDGMTPMERAQNLKVQSEAELMMDVLWAGMRRKRARKEFVRRGGFIDVDASVGLEGEEYGSDVELDGSDELDLDEVVRREREFVEMEVKNLEREEGKSDEKKGKEEKEEEKGEEQEIQH